MMSSKSQQLLRLSLDHESLSLGLVADLENLIGFFNLLDKAGDVKLKRLLWSLSLDLKGLSLAVAGPGGRLRKSNWIF